MTDWKWQIFKAGMQRRTGERVGIQIRHIWFPEKFICSQCGVSGQAVAYASK